MITAAVLVVINMAGFNSNNTIITMQEFSTMRQCQYVMGLIKEKGTIRDAFCVNK